MARCLCCAGNTSPRWPVTSGRGQDGDLSMPVRGRPGHPDAVERIGPVLAGEIGSRQGDRATSGVSCGVFWNCGACRMGWPRQKTIPLRRRLGRTGVTISGNDHRAIFEDDADRIRFIERLGERQREAWFGAVAAETL